MEKMAWMADYDGLYYEVSPETKRLLNEARARRRSLAWMTGDDGSLTAKLSAMAEAVSAAVGLEVVAKRAQTVAIPERHLGGYAPAEPVAREEIKIPVFDFQDQMERHRESAVRLDELTRLKARDEYEESKHATAPDAAAVPALAVVTSAPTLKQSVQEKRILELLIAQGHDPLNLPARGKGRRGAKAEVKELALLESSLFSDKSFDKAWDRLRGYGDVVGAK